jgi:hypothetical protein
MERMIREITEQLINKLPEDREYYTPEDLQVLDIPEFITERVVIEMNQNLNESLSPPDTEWAAMDNPAVQFAWKNFIEAIKAEVKMPATYAQTIFETAIADTMELALRPRRAIPESLFGSDKELSIELVKKRIRYITVGRQLAAALVRYMEKKNKKKITLDECRDIVAKVDEKLIAGYNSLDWAKETEPLFQLAGPKVDTEFLRIYFEDKARNKVALKFDMITEPVNRTAFIEILSAPELDEDQLAAKKSEAGSTKKAAQKTDNKEKPDSDAGTQKKPADKDVFIPDDSILGSFQKRRVGSMPDDEYEEAEEKADLAVPDEEIEPVSTSEPKEKPLHERFVFDSDALDDDSESNKEPSTIYDEMNFKRITESEDDELLEGNENSLSSIPQFDSELMRKWKTIGGISEDEDEPVLEETEKPEDEDEPVASIELYNETDDEEDVPMWRAFLEREDLSKLKEEEQDFIDDEDIQSGLKSTASEPADSEEIHAALDSWIGDKKEKFIEEIFGGSDRAYKEALTEIERKKDWKTAAKFLEKEVFNKNKIKLFDEIAVEFTDKLQSYYTQKKA